MVLLTLWSGIAAAGVAEPTIAEPVGSEAAEVEWIESWTRRSEAMEATGSLHVLNWQTAGGNVADGRFSRARRRHRRLALCRERDQHNGLGVPLRL